MLNIAVNLIEWEGLPDEIDPRFLELTLVTQGMALFFRDDDLDEYLALQTMIGGDRLTPYRVPIRRTAYDINGAQWHRTNKDSVIIFNNYLRQPDYPVIMDYATRLYEIQRAIDVNIKGQKTPYLIKTSQQQLLTVKNLYNQIDDNEAAIYADKNLDLDGVKILPSVAPFVSDKLQVLKAQLFNEFLTYCGVENPGFEKRERVQNGEIEVTLGAVEASRYSRLSAREDAAKQINVMFGLDIKPKYREFSQRFDNDAADTEEVDPLE